MCFRMIHGYRPVRLIARGSCARRFHGEGCRTRGAGVAGTTGVCTGHGVGPGRGVGGSAGGDAARQDGRAEAGGAGGERDRPGHCGGARLRGHHGQVDDHAAGRDRCWAHGHRGCGGLAEGRLHRSDGAAGLTVPGPGDTTLVGARADGNPPQGDGMGDHVGRRALGAGQHGLRRATFAGQGPEGRVLVHQVGRGGEGAGGAGLVVGQVVARALEACRVVSAAVGPGVVGHDRGAQGGDVVLAAVDAAAAVPRDRAADDRQRPVVVHAGTETDAAGAPVFFAMVLSTMVMVPPP